MTKLLRLLLLIPVIALGQELPDEDWFCVDEKQVSVKIGSPPLESELHPDANRYIFNPSKGLRLFSSENFFIENNECESFEDIDIYACQIGKSWLQTFLVK